MKLFLCKLIFTCAAAAEPEVTPRAELVYGTVLYDYYQENYSDALLQVRVAQEQGYTSGAETKFKLAEGSFAFSDQMFDYATEIRSMTQGKGGFSMEFKCYRQAPKNIQEEVLEKRRKEKEMAKK